MAQRDKQALLFLAFAVAMPFLVLERARFGRAHTTHLPEGAWGVAILLSYVAHVLLVGLIVYGWPATRGSLGDRTIVKNLSRRSVFRWALLLTLIGYSVSLGVAVAMW